MKCREKKVTIKINISYKLQANSLQQLRKKHVATKGLEKVNIRWCIQTYNYERNIVQFPNYVFAAGSRKKFFFFLFPQWSPCSGEVLGCGLADSTLIG